MEDYEGVKQQIERDFFTPNANDALTNAILGYYTSMKNILNEGRYKGSISKEEEKEVLDAHNETTKDAAENKRLCLINALDLAREGNSKEGLEEWLKYADNDSRTLGFPLAESVKKRIREIHDRNSE